MGRVELTERRPFLAPGLDELPVFRKLHDSGIAVTTMSIGDKDLAIGCNYNVGRLIEGVRTITGNSGLAQGHQNLSFGTKLDYLMALAIFSLRIRDPHISALVDKDAVRKNKQPLAEALEQFACRIKSEDRRQVRASTSISAAPLRHPYAAVRADVDRTGRSPRPPLGELRPVLDRAVRIGLRVGWGTGLAECFSRHAEQHNNKDNQQAFRSIAATHQRASLNGAGIVSMFCCCVLLLA